MKHKFAGLFGSVAAIPLTAGLGLGLYARLVEPRRFETTTVSLKLQRWPAALDGLLLALVSDIHLGRRLGHAWTTPSLRAAVRSVRAARPDILVVAGDFAFGRWDPAGIAHAAAAFDAPVRVAILGNHDYAHGRTRARALAKHLAGEGFTVLVNDACTATVRGHPVWFVGLDDADFGRPNEDGALAEVPADAAPVIGLVHEPDAAGRLAGHVDLVLSGHTHGGQLAIPVFNGLVLRYWARTNYDRGLYDVGGTPLYVSKGLGMVGFHARFRSRPEAVFLRLHSVPPSTC